MKKDALFLLIIAILFLGAVLLTVLLGKGKTRHGMGWVTPPSHEVPHHNSYPPWFEPDERDT